MHIQLTPNTPIVHSFSHSIQRPISWIYEKCPRIPALIKLCPGPVAKPFKAICGRIMRGLNNELCPAAASATTITTTPPKWFIETAISQPEHHQNPTTLPQSKVGYKNERTGKLEDLRINWPPLCSG